MEVLNSLCCTMCRFLKLFYCLTAQSALEIGTPAIDVVVDIVKKYHGKVPMAVASSGIRSHVLESLRMNDLEKVSTLYMHT